MVHVITNYAWSEGLNVPLVGSYTLSVLLLTVMVIQPNDFYRIREEEEG